jgi:hypothetical protein
VCGIDLLRPADAARILNRAAWRFKKKFAFATILGKNQGISFP